MAKETGTMPGIFIIGNFSAQNGLRRLFNDRIGTGEIMFQRPPPRGDYCGWQ